MTNSQQDEVTIPRAQRVYGEIIYWLTIAACIVCMVGPAISIAVPDNNVLDPYRLFDAIFEGKSADEVWSEVEGGFPGGPTRLRATSDWRAGPVPTR